MKRPLLKRILVLLLVLGILGASGVLIAARIRRPNPAEQTQYKLAPVEIGTVKKTVSATGTLQPWRMVDIKSKAGGRVDALLVDIGDVVKKGQVLARIDPADTLLNYNTAVADLKSAEARALQNERSYQLQVRQSEIAIANAEAQLRSAKASLKAAVVRRDRARTQLEAQPKLWKASVSSAGANLESAQKQLNQLQQATFPQERAAAQSSLDQAVANRKNAEAILKRQMTLYDKGFVSEQVVDQARASFEVAQAQERSAREKMETLEAEQKAELEAAQARERQASAQLASAQAQEVDLTNTKHALAEAEAAVLQATAQVATAQAALDQARANRANNEIRRFDIESAKAAVARAEASRINAKVTLDQTNVVAPSDGVILKKYVEQGTIISSALSFAATGNNILQLGDITRMYVDVTVDETDIANVDEGQTVEVSVDAYQGVPFEGKVSRIDPQAQVEQNVTTVHVRVEIDNSAPTFRLLKPGMNATCEFVVDQRENVAMVPTDAVRTDDSGTFVEVGTGGHKPPPDPKATVPPDPDMLVGVKVKRQAVEVGLEGNDMVEIISGLKPGQKVVTQTIEPAPTTAGSPFGAQGMRPFGMRGAARAPSTAGGRSGGGR